MFRFQHTLSVIFLLCFFQVKTVFAQPLLPDMAIVHQDGINILTWVCQYDGIKSVIVQRSADSNFNYTTIGYVRNTKKGVQYFLDGHALPGVNWYRVKVVFGSDLVWTSNRVKIEVDSAQLAKARVLPPNDSLQLLAAKLRTKVITIQDSSSGKTDNRTVIYSNPTTKTDSAGGTKPTQSGISISIEVPDIENVNAYSYIKSQYVFTNPFTGHVNIEIADVATAKYSIDFYDNNNVRVLQVPHISEANLILDKRNFQHVGLFKFELFKDKVKLETGYITIY